MKRVLRGLAAGSAALVVSIGTGVAAMAAGPEAEPDVTASIGTADAASVVDELVDDLPDVNIGNDLCLLPWYWPGPANILTEGQSGHYLACNRTGSSDGEGINILNNVCAAPWLWQGPVNAGTSDESAYYVVCNGDAAPSEGGVNILNDACVLPWLWQGPVNVFTEGEDATYVACNSEGKPVEVEPLTGETTGAVADSVNVGNDLCALPWLWQGPLNLLTDDESAYYEACNDDGTLTADGANLLNGACVAPWLWQGPVNLLTDDKSAHYEGCNR